MVRIIDPGPDPSVAKQVICKNCGAKLEYVPHDLTSYTASDYGGGRDTYYYFNCPKCHTKVHVSR